MDGGIFLEGWSSLFINVNDKINEGIVYDIKLFFRYIYIVYIL